VSAKALIMTNDKSALRFAIKTMDEYQFPIGVITAVLNTSESTVQRHEGHPVRRPVREVTTGDIRTARKVVMIKMLKADFHVADIMGVTHVSKDTVYRQFNQLMDMLEAYTPEQQRIIMRSLPRGHEPLMVQERNQQQQVRRWRSRLHRPSDY